MWLDKTILLLVFLTISLGTTLRAQDSEAQASATTVPESVLHELANDLADLQVTIQDAGNLRIPYYPDAIMTMMGTAEAKSGASESSPMVYRLEPGKVYPIIDKAGEWYAVAGPNDQSGWVSASHSVPIYSQMSIVKSPRATMADSIYQKLMDQVSTIRDKYKNNPYMQVSGFTISLGTNISVSVNIDFK